MIASIQKVTNIRPHKNADLLSLCNVLGWQVVIKKGEYSDDDLVVYVAIDSLLPDKPEFEFLRSKGFKIKPIKLRGEESAGIVFPLDILPDGDYSLGQEVSDLIGATHYEKPIPTCLAGKVIGSFPSFLRMTDEKNIRSYPDIIEEMKGQAYYITEKEDGSSGTFFVNDGKYGVCSRKLQLEKDLNNGFWKVSEKYNIEENIKRFFGNSNICIQGEVVGPAVQKNRLCLTSLEIRVFNIFDIYNRTYYSYDEIKKFCEDCNIPMVKVLEVGDNFQYTISDLISMANNAKYSTGKPAEGIVVRLQNSNRVGGMLSGKIISENDEEEKKK